MNECGDCREPSYFAYLEGLQAAKCALIEAPEILPSGALFGTKLGNKEL
jgi:hypothetical protein